MKVKAFEEFVKSHAHTGLNDINYNVIGLCGESGEVAEWVKKAVHRKNPAFKDKHLKKELGDVLHYLTRIALDKGWGLKDIMQCNYDKLMERDGRVDPKYRVQPDLGGLGQITPPTTLLQESFLFDKLEG